MLKFVKESVSQALCVWPIDGRKLHVHCNLANFVMNGNSINRGRRKMNFIAILIAWFPLPKSPFTQIFKKQKNRLLFFPFQQQTRRVASLIHFPHFSKTSCSSIKNTKFKHEGVRKCTWHQKTRGRRTL